MLSVRPERRAIDRATFESSMALLGPFERVPLLAVAVSGGGDSLALCLLADEWARARGGAVLALTVDHALRAGSTAEAVEVGRWLRLRGIAHQILTRSIPLEGGLQEGARKLRYRLLEQACAASGILHLLVGHTREDQAETVALRRAHGSGPMGLSAMAPLVETPRLRLLRPLLTAERASLRAYLMELGQAWIEDPSNDDRRFERIRLRQAAGMASDVGADRERLVSFAADRGVERDKLDRAVNALIAAHGRLFPEGYATVADAVFAADGAVLERLITRLCLTIGGQPYPPGRAQLDRLIETLSAGGRGGSLGRCVFSRRGGDLLVYREARLLPDPVPLVPGHSVEWDGRYTATLAEGIQPGLAVGAVGQKGLFRLERAMRDESIPPASLPKAIWTSLPAIYHRGAICAVPHLRYNDGDGRDLAWDLLCLEFRPAHPLTAPGRRLV
jgi:tRNA(Ile)-lysidine synthase